MAGDSLKGKGEREEPRVIRQLWRRGNFSNFNTTASNECYYLPEPLIHFSAVYVSQQTFVRLPHTLCRGTVVLGKVYRDLRYYQLG